MIKHGLIGLRLKNREFSAHWMAAQDQYHSVINIQTYTFHTGTHALLIYGILENNECFTLLYTHGPTCPVYNPSPVELQYSAKSMWPSKKGWSYSSIWMLLGLNVHQSHMGVTFRRPHSFGNIVYVKTFYRGMEITL